MAQQVKIFLVSDMDGEAADETVQFSLDGTSYEIDLSAEHAAELRSTFKQYVEAGRKVSAAASARSRVRSAAAAGSAPEESRKIREWAKDNGYSVSERGRIASEINDAYHKAMADR